MAIVAVFALLALFSIISIVLSAEEPDQPERSAPQPVPVDGARSPLDATHSLSHRCPGTRRGISDSWRGSSPLPVRPMSQPR